MRFRVMASRHSPFYTPLLACVRCLRDQGHDVSYAPLASGQKTWELLRDGAADVVQSAVSSNWRLLERGVAPLPVHFAQINCRDGFFLAARDAEPAFAWSSLEARTLDADPGEQPLAMLRYAVWKNGVDWTRIRIARGSGADYVHQQGPIVGREIVASVGASMPPVAFSSLCCSGEYLARPECDAFRDAFARTKEWSRTAPPALVAERIEDFFPGVPREALADSVRRYQELGTWEGGIAIPRDLYEQALDVFAFTGGIATRHAYDDVVGG